MGSINYDSSDVLDFLIVGAGISGINAAYRIKDELPDKKYAILEGRENLGGTWDLFKYPGIRSDSDLHTFGYAFKEWTGADIAEGKEIVAYLNRVADENGITQNIHFKTTVTNADWSTEQRCWFVTADQNGEQKQFRSRFLYTCTGYYDYHAALEADIPGIKNFKGKVVHPQFWNVTEDDYRGKRVAVIGSGATAITLIPSMADVAKDVTLVQRSPTYIVSLDKYDPIAKVMRAVMPRRMAAFLIRQKNILRIYASYHIFRTFPGVAKRILRTMAKAQLPKDIPLDPHFKPSYNPWDQRLCICPDGDFYTTLREGKAHIATGHIDQVTSNEIILKNGERIPCDLIVTATGLKLHIGGHIQTSVDKKPVKANELFVWKGCMMESLPNYAISIGYTNASWTLGSDCTAQYVVRLVKHMDKYHKSMAVPKPSNREQLEEGPLLNLTSTYVKKAENELPKAATTGPWRMRTNYWYDLVQAKYGGYDDIVFQ
ncbi:flavin-containing monooxygenase-like protein [Moesziomyces antarcticus]|uniref:Probable monooxygenase n=1 Tax=Pseudozyma antarctica TaxID=84753 RepID=A0A5C3FIZ1_PSEA2|nr:flavin-containing monooxygenase-like protein [Moesziomyces antarcticus]GAK63559.1 flavin-containing monooxygenase-like protein [Moesziomyces antarcticus]SPO44150.1 probable monooxygenase [Moesziomyces antarcticus]